MDNIFQYLKELKEINSIYEIDNSEIEDIEKKMYNSKVCLPIIGKFSSGKTALLNGILDIGNRRILKEGITPETAVPTEIIFNNEEYAIVYYKNNTIEEMSIEELKEIELDYKKIDHIKLNLNIEFMHSISNVKLVDLPGFESGFEIHDKAIDDYSQNSMAYILTIPADDMVLRKSIGDIINELCLRNIPICVVITKYDKCNSEFDESFTQLKEKIKKYIGNSDIEYCITSSFQGEFEDLKDYLYSIENNSGRIIYSYFENKIKSNLANTISYLETMLKKIDLSEFELDEEKDKLKDQLDKLNEKIYDERNKFSDKLCECVEDVKNDLRKTLGTSKNKFVVMSMNGQSIQSELNILIRNTVTRSIKERVNPLFKKYISNVEKFNESEIINDFPIELNIESKGNGKEIVSSVVAAAASAVLGLPLIAVGIAALIGGKLMGSYKREEQKNNISAKIENEIYPRVINDVSNNIDKAISKEEVRINDIIEKNINKQKETILKAIEDLKVEMDKEEKLREDKINMINKNIKRLEEIINELQY